MSLTKIFLWLLLVLVAVLAGVAVAAIQYGTQRRTGRRTTLKKSLPTDGETVYSELGEDHDEAALDMDPLSEAEVYLAYGNKDAALRVLIQAARKTPRPDLLAKIEEIRAGDRAV